MAAIGLNGCRHWYRVGVHKLKKLFCGGDSIPPSWAVPELTRFERIYLSCKQESELWAVYQLLLIKLLRVGTPESFDQETGELLPALDCSWTVLAVVFVGELAGDILASLLLWALGKWAPWLKVDVPTSSTQPSSSPVVCTIVLLFGAYASLITLGGMGNLAVALSSSS